MWTFYLLSFCFLCLLVTDSLATSHLIKTAVMIIHKLLIYAQFSFICHVMWAHSVFTTNKSLWGSAIWVKTALSEVRMLADSRTVKTEDFYQGLWHAHVWPRKTRKSSTEDKPADEVKTLLYSEKLDVQAPRKEETAMGRLKERVSLHSR